MEHIAIFAKHFRTYQQKKLGFCAFLGSLIILLSVCNVFKPSFSHLPILNLQVSVRATLGKLMFQDTCPQRESSVQHPDEGYLRREIKLVCNVVEARSDFCNIEGDVRINGTSSTILFLSSQMDVLRGNESWRIRPYARKSDVTAMGFVKEVLVKAIVDNRAAPRCTINHCVPAVVFSIGGYAGNYFHDVSDILVPLFVTSRQFDGKVQFLVTNARSYWLSKYKPILSSLSRYDIIEMDKENAVHCFPSVTVGLFQNDPDLRIDPSKSPNGYSMNDYRKFLRKSYSLKKENAIRIGDSRFGKPRLLIISRNRTRSITNEGDLAQMATNLGFDVVVTEPGLIGLSELAHIVNSCDVMMGVHGAGLTNLVFLPSNAILIQIVPWGKLEGVSRHTFGEPAVGMRLRYLEYNIREGESSLIQKYPLNHAVFTDPMSIRKQGWDAFKSIYLEKQNVKLDVGRFESTLLEALELLSQ